MPRITDLYSVWQRKQRPNIDTSHRCAFKCPQCIRQRITSQAQIRRSFDLEEAEFEKMLNYYERGITFCGQISDPIYHPNFLNLLKMCDQHKNNHRVRIATVGSGKSDAWWDEAYSYGVGKNAWYFGVDGIDEKSELYRVGSDFKDVWQRMRQGRALGHLIIWQFIIFGYNEHEVERAAEIAKEEDFNLLMINTNRGFNPQNPLLRKTAINHIGQLEKPKDENREKVIKKEWWVNVTPDFKKWNVRSL